MSTPTRADLLLVDDDEAITDALGAVLERSGFDVRVAADGRAGLDAVAAKTPDIVVCDVVMPHLDGREFVRRLRERDLWLPVILLTQVGESWERSAALDEGADDYLNKPFDPQELISRIRAVLRRASQGTAALPAASKLRAADLLLDRTSRRVWLAEGEITLTPKALTLLEYLMTHPQEALARERLLTALWGFDFASSSRAVDHRIAELRRVLGDDPTAPRFIDTAPGLGYRFVATVVPG